jgi:hypothetical protein
LNLFKKIDLNSLGKIYLEDWEKLDYPANNDNFKSPQKATHSPGSDRFRPPVIE